MKKDIIDILICVVLSIIAFLISTSWIKILIFFVSYLFIGHDVIKEAIEKIKDKRFCEEEFLMTLASCGAFIMGEYPEAIAVMLFFKIGEMFEEFAEGKTEKSIKSLMEIKPEFANVKLKEKIIKKSPEEVQVGNIIIVKPGEKIPLDGFIINGEALIDTSALTGESIPRKVKVNDEILSGTINTNGVLEIYVTKEYGESTVHKILNLVENSIERKAPSEKFITKFARIYTPVVVIIAILLAIIPGLVFNGEWSTWIYRALTFLVISCPCALVISVPLSFFGGLGGESKKGILVKGGNYIEVLSKLDTVVFDKTGTLTKGVFKVQKIEPENMKEKILEIAAYAEVFSNHPIAQSIVLEYSKEIDKNRITEYKEISGQGVSAKIDGDRIYAGNTELMKSIGINIEKEKSIGTIIYIAKDEKYLGKILISDEIKEGAKSTIDALKNNKVKQIVMLTGDRKIVGDKVGKKLGIGTVYSELLPTDKVEKLEEIMKNTKNKVAFVGDGLNDAPVLAIADIGIAMGAYGSDAAIEAADSVIMTDEPSKIIDAIKIAKKTMRIVKQNIFFAIGIKLLVLVLGFFGVATMWEAVFADVGVTILATLNALRTLKIKN